MSRVKRGNVLQKRHKKILKYAKGFVGSKSRLFTAANQAVMKALRNAYRDRKKRKRDFRRLWIVRINAICRQNGITYGRFINALKQSNILLNRQMLANIAVHNEAAFVELINTVKNKVA